MALHLGVIHCQHHFSVSAQNMIFFFIIQGLAHTTAVYLLCSDALHIMENQHLCHVGSIHKGNTVPVSGRLLPFFMCTHAEERKKIMKPNLTPVLVDSQTSQFSSRFSLSPSVASVHSNWILTPPPVLEGT